MFLTKSRQVMGRSPPFWRDLRFILSFNLLVTFTLGVAALTGDHLLLFPRFGNLERAVIDSVTHGIVGGLSWVIVSQIVRYPTLNKVFEIMLCAFISSAIDIDHFIAARSFSLRDVQRLQTRPFLHCTSIVTIACLVSICYFYIYGYNTLIHYVWLTLTAFLSHHIRDGFRRGLWIWPFGSTRAIPFLIYVLTMIAFPHVMSVVILFTGGVRPQYHPLLHHV